MITLIALARQTGTRPSALLHIDDAYTAYCLDEACLFMTEQAQKKKEPDFGRPKRLQEEEKKKTYTTNSEAVSALVEAGLAISR